MGTIQDALRRYDTKERALKAATKTQVSVADTKRKKQQQTAKAKNSSQSSGSSAQKKVKELSNLSGRDALVKHAYAMAEERSAANKSTKAKGRMATPRNTAAIQSRKAAPTVDKILDKTPYKKGKDLSEVETRRYNDNFGGQFKANYTLGDLQQQSAYAWNLFMKHPNQHYLKRAQDIDKAMEAFRANNTDALDDVNAKASWVSKSLAGYLPQLRNQAAEAGAAMALGGAAGLFGAPMGIAAKAGYMGGMTSSAYDSMRGMAYKNLRDMGVDDATARAASKDEAVLSSIIELGESGIDVLTFGFGRLLGAAGRKAVTPAAKSAARKLFGTLRNYGVQIGGESLEEGLQEGISIANERRAQQGQTGLGNLALQSDRVLQDAITGKDPEARQRILENAKEGAKISAMMGGGTVLAPNIAANRMETWQRREYEETAPEIGAEKRKISMEDFVNNESPVWNMLDGADTMSQKQIAQDTFDRMVAEGRVAKVGDEIANKVEQYYPDLRDMKKKDRVPIIRQKMNELKSSLRSFLNDMKGVSYEFEVNGNILEAKLYGVGINEVLDAVTEQKAKMLYSSADIFRNAQYLYSLPDTDSDPNIYRWNYFLTPVKIGEDTVAVRVAVRDMVNPVESQIYNWNIKKDASLGGDGRGVSRISTGASSETSDVDNIVPQNNNGVNTVYAGGGENIQGGGYMAFEQRNPTLTEEIQEEPASYAPETAAPAAGQTIAGGFGPARFKEQKQGSEEREIVTNSMARSENLTAVKDALVAAGQHKRGVVTMAQAQQEAENFIRQNGGYDAVYDSYIADPNSARSLTAAENAVVIMLMEHYANLGANDPNNVNTQKASRVAERFLEVSTDEARALNMHKLILMNSPAGALLYAKRMVNRASQELERKGKKGKAAQANLTEQDEKDILALGMALQMNAVPEERFIENASPDLKKWLQEAWDYAEKGYVDFNEVCTGKYASIISNRLPSSFRAKFRALQRISMLSNLRTVVSRNMGGNVLQGAGAVASQPFSKVFDVLLQQMTGEASTTAFSVEGMGKGFKQGVQKAITEKKLGISSVKGNRVKDSIDREIQGQAFNPDMVNSKAAKALYRGLNKADETIGFVLQLGDDPFRMAHYQQVLNQIMKAQGVTEPTADMMEAAMQSATRSVFQDDNAITKALENVRNQLGIPGDIIAPYLRTPVNVLKISLEYSPIGTVEAIYKTFYGENSLKAMKSRGESTIALQRQIAELFGRGALGTGLILLGSLAAGIAGENADDEKERQWLSFKGGNANSLRIGNTYVDMSSLQGPTTAFLMGASAANMPWREEDGSFNWAKVLQLASNLGGGALEMPVLQGVRDLFTGAYETDQVALGLLGMILDGGTQVIPGASLLKQISAARDPYVRVNKSDKKGAAKVWEESIVNPLKNTFFQRSDLPIKRDAFGNPVQNTAASGGLGRTLNTFLNPFNTSVARETDVTREGDRLRELRGGNDVLPSTAPANLSSDNQDYTLTMAERSQWQETQGKKLNEILTDLISTQEYQSATDEEKAKLWMKAGEAARETAKEEFLQSKGVSHDKESILEDLETLQKEGVPLSKALYWRTKLQKMDNDKVSYAERNKALLDDPNLTEKEKELFSKTFVKDGFYRDTTKDVDFSGGEEGFYISMLSKEKQDHWYRFQQQGWTPKQYYEMCKLWKNRKADTIQALKQAYGWTDEQATWAYNAVEHKNF